MSWILTYTGRRVDLLDPDPATIEPEDIAHALSNMCRFNGHCRHFYSVAEHSWHVALLVSRENALQGLMHDAAEAYVADITRPLKPYLTNYAAFRELNQELMTGSTI
ncbi:MAG TPA: hypothetical protein VKA50_11875 [Gammaproteobacteria bacterium]|nr:hypothetical protein [Gammaproteobacteria bacterium]